METFIIPMHTRDESLKYEIIVNMKLHPVSRQLYSLVICNDANTLIQDYEKDTTRMLKDIEERVKVELKEKYPHYQHKGTLIEKITFGTINMQVSYSSK